MIDPDYAARHLGGVWKMAWNAPGWEDSLDRSVDGVFKSFWAAALTAPIAIAGFISGERAASRIPDLAGPGGAETPLGLSIAAEAVAFIAVWSVQLAALVLSARAAGRTRRIADIIIGFNWMQVYVSLAQSAPFIVLGLTLKREFAGFVALPALAFIVALYWGVLRRSLGVGAASTLAVFALLLLLELVTTSLISAGALALYRLFG